MKGAIASVEIFAHRKPAEGSSAERNGSTEIRRLTLVIGAPQPVEGEGWSCRVALADLERPVKRTAPDSVLALAEAQAQGRLWLADLEGEGWVLYRDRAGTDPFVWV